MSQERRKRAATVAHRVEAILDALGSHSSVQEREAERRLAALEASAFPYLAVALHRHPNANARAVAASALGRFTSRAQMPLLRALRDPAMSVRLHALVALDRVWSARVAASVVTLLDDPSPGVRHNAIRVLARRRVREAIPRLVRSLLRDPDWHVRQQAALALGMLGGHRASWSLRRAMADPRRAVRDAATSALRRMETSSDAFVV